jgi:hypothetical protein
VMNLKLADPDEAQAFVDTNHGEHGGATPMGSPLGDFAVCGGSYAAGRMV